MVSSLEKSEKAWEGTLSLSLSMVTEQDCSNIMLQPSYLFGVFYQVCLCETLELFKNGSVHWLACLANAVGYRQGKKAVMDGRMKSAKAIVREEQECEALELDKYRT